MGDVYLIVVVTGLRNDDAAPAVSTVSDSIVAIDDVLVETMGMFASVL